MMMRWLILDLFIHLNRHSIIYDKGTWLVGLTFGEENLINIHKSITRRNNSSKHGSFIERGFRTPSLTN